MPPGQRRPSQTLLCPSAALWDLWLFGFPHTRGLLRSLGICRDGSPILKRMGKPRGSGTGLAGVSFPVRGFQTAHPMIQKRARGPAQRAPDLLPGSQSWAPVLAVQQLPACRKIDVDVVLGRRDHTCVPNSSQAGGQASCSWRLLSLLWEGSGSVWLWGHRRLERGDQDREGGRQPRG